MDGRDNTQRPRTEGGGETQDSHVEALARHRKYGAPYTMPAIPVLYWGTQQEIRPASESAKRATASQRIHRLAQSKTYASMVPTQRVHLYLFSTGLPSTIWKINPAALRATATERLVSMARPKLREVHTDTPRLASREDDGRSAAGQTGRMAELALPRGVHPDYRVMRLDAAAVTRASLTAAASPRLADMAVAKRRSEPPIGDTEWQVTAAAKRATISARSDELAKPKSLSDEYRFAHPPERQVSRGSKRAVASSRTVEISQPIIRQTMNAVLYDVDAFKVKTAALSSVCSSRTRELSQPVQR